jgi:glycosyltransferase involved in cell wall biosynthesis
LSSQFQSGLPHPQQIIALIGRADSPTDALEDYCHWLKDSLNSLGQPMEILRVPWATDGWIGGLQWASREAKNWRGKWIVVQYTALGWSNRGFPVGVVLLMWIAQRRGAKCAVVFHDAVPYGGPRWIDRVRRAVQVWVMRNLYRRAQHSIMPVPIEKVPWLPAANAKAKFIPIAANLSGTLVTSVQADSAHDDVVPKTVAIFGVTGAPRLLPETEFIADVVRQAAQKLKTVRLIVLGRNADGAEAPLRAALAGTNIDLVVYGVLPADEIERRLSETDVLLFVRGGISSRRGSAMAGIACGLPVVAYEGSETGPPITEAGVLLSPEGDRNALAMNLAKVLSDDDLRNSLRKRSLEARDNYFSWNVIARKFLQVLNDA